MHFKSTIVALASAACTAQAVSQSGYSRTDCTGSYISNQNVVENTCYRNIDRRFGSILHRNAPSGDRTAVFVPSRTDDNCGTLKNERPVGQCTDDGGGQRGGITAWGYVTPNAQVKRRRGLKTSAPKDAPERELVLVDGTRFKAGEDRPFIDTLLDWAEENPFGTIGDIPSGFSSLLIN